MAKKRVTVAIDPSLSNTAVIVGDASGYEVGCFNVPFISGIPNHRIARYEAICGKVMVGIEAMAGGAEIDHILIEHYSFASKGRREDLAENGAILRQGLLGITHRL